MGYEYMELPFEFKAEDIQEDGIFKGYGSTFGGKPDSYGDVVARGAFKETLTKGGWDGKGVKMLWQHDAKQPIGIWTNLEEDKKGLYVEGKLTRGVQKADEAYLLMKDKAMSGLSIGYKAEKWEYDKKKQIRYLKEVNLMEISPVTFGANIRAQITNVKSAIKEAKNIRELEWALRDKGLSRSDSMYIIKMCKPYLREISGMKNVLSSLKEINDSFEAKKVIPFKSYPLAGKDVSWNGPVEVRKAEAEDLKKMCTWYDSENADVKSAYKLPHHTASGYKTVWRGVVAAMAALKGARGGVQIPDSDKRGVYNHLAKHYRQFDEEPPEF